MDRKFTEQELIRRQSLLELQQNNNNPFEVEKIERSMTLDEFNKKFEGYDKEELHNKKFADLTLAGRVMNIRQTFGVIKDFSGTAQFYLNKKELPETIFSKFKSIDIGDIVELIGTPMKTNTGLITLNVSDLKIVSKALKVLPEKYHGLVDEEIRARNRYVDLIVNEESMQTFIKRSLIIKAIREYMDNDGFFEVETPVLNPVLGGASARPFITHHNALDREYYLRIATELPLKKCIVGGFEKVYEIGRIFRNEGMNIIGRSIGDDYHQRKATLSFIEMTENAIHAKSYSSIFTTYLPTNSEIDEVFDWCENNDDLQAICDIIISIYKNLDRHNYAKQFNEKIDNKEVSELDFKIAQWKAMVASTYLETYLFYSGFYYPLWFYGQGKLMQAGEIKL